MDTDEPPRAVSLRTRNKNTNYALPAQIELSDADRTGQPASDSDNEEEEEIRCVCGSKDETGSNWVQCDQCKAWQHQNCVGLEGKKLPKSKNYYCEVRSGRANNGRKRTRGISKDHSESSGDAEDSLPSSKKEKRAPASTTVPKVDGRVLANKARSKKYQAAAAAAAAVASSKSSRNASSASSISTLVNSTSVSSAHNPLDSAKHPSNSTLHSDSDMMTIDPPSAAPRKPSKSSKSSKPHGKTSKLTTANTNYLNACPPSPSMSAKNGTATAPHVGFRDTTPNKFGLGHGHGMSNGGSPHHPHNVSHRTSLADMQRRVGQLQAYLVTLEQRDSGSATAGGDVNSTPVRNSSACCCGSSVTKQEQQQQDCFASDSSDCSVLTPPLSTTSPSPMFGTLLAQQKSAAGSGSDSEGSGGVGGGVQTHMLPAVDSKTRTAVSAGKVCVSCNSSNGNAGCVGGGRGLDDGGVPSWVILQRVRERLDAFVNEFGN
ncbi:hypothetical protein HDU98_002636 [Podochytrium sp. JEL0797]|nr:hypothetical protein HDU98_002636 [Podochytrium sp. JEL0797]